METTQHFTDERQALSIPPPRVKTHVEHFHLEDRVFGIRIMRQRGSQPPTRVWIARWTERGKTRRENLGPVAEKDYHQARAEALTFKGNASAGTSNALAFKTLGQVYESYKSVRKSGWSDTTIEDYEKKWAYVEAFGLARKKVNAVREDDVIELQTFVLGVVQANSPVDPDGKPIRNGQASAVAVLRLVKILFNSLVRRGAVTSNPLGEMVEAGLFRKNEPRSRMIKAKDLPIVWHWLHHEAHPAVRDYILCALLLGLRSSVAGSLRWDNLVEQDGKWIYIMRADQKGNKRRQEIPIPVPTYLADIVIKPRLASPTKHATWIIESPKRRGHPMKSIRGSMSALESKTKIKLSMHDLRRTIATFAHKATDPLTARRILSHSVMAAIDRQATSAGYIIQTIDDLRDGMNKTVDYILKIIDDAKKSPSV